MDKKILRNISYGVYVVSTKYDNKDAGCIINTLTQITSENPLISISLNKNNYTSELLKKANKFIVAIIFTNISLIFIFIYFHLFFTSGFLPFFLILASILGL